VVTVTAEYITSEEHLPEDTGGEITFQITNAETKEIFTTRARIAREPAELSDPERLTVVRGPHENIEEEWYIDIIEEDIDPLDIDNDLLRECIRKSRDETNIVNARSDDLRALLVYLVETGHYQSVSDAVRAILREHLTDHAPELVETYIDVRTEFERDDLADRLGRDER
jgi:Arc/MetJ-type ribon-helix-helix transcriptional regulator